MAKLSQPSLYDEIHPYSYVTPRPFEEAEGITPEEKKEIEAFKSNIGNLVWNQRKEVEEEAYDKFKTDYERRNPGKIFELPEHLREQYETRYGLTPEGDTAVDKYGKELSKFYKFKNQYLKNRFEKMSEPERQVEVSADYSSLDFVIKNNFTRGLTTNVVGEKEHPVYGMYAQVAHPVAGTVSGVIGGLSNFIALSKLFQASGLVAKTAQLLQKTHAGEKALEAAGRGALYTQTIGRTGQILEGLGNTAQAAKISKTMFEPIRALQMMKNAEYVAKALPAAQIHALNTAMVEGFKSVVSGHMEFLEEQEKKTNKEYWKVAPLAIKNLAEGLVGGTFMHIFNQPGARGYRIVADGLYSAGSSAYRAATGQQEFSMNNFMYDWLLSSSIGEVMNVDWRKLSNAPNSISASLRRRKINKTLDSAIDGDGYLMGNRDQLSVLLQTMDAKSREATNRHLTDVELKNSVDFLKGTFLSSDFMTINESIRRPSNLKIEINDRLSPVYNKQVVDLYDKFFKAFGISNKAQQKMLFEKDAMRTEQRAVAFLKELKAFKYKEATIPDGADLPEFLGENTPRITTKQFETRMDAAIRRMTNGKSDFDTIDPVKKRIREAQEARNDKLAGDAYETDVETKRGVSDINATLTPEQRQKAIKIRDEILKSEKLQKLSPEERSDVGFDLMNKQLTYFLTEKLPDVKGFAGLSRTIARSKAGAEAAKTADVDPDKLTTTKDYSEIKNRFSLEQINAIMTHAYNNSDNFAHMFYLYMRLNGWGAQKAREYMKTKGFENSGRLRDEKAKKLFYENAKEMIRFKSREAYFFNEEDFRKAVGEAVERKPDTTINSKTGLDADTSSLYFKRNVDNGAYVFDFAPHIELIRKHFGDNAADRVLEKIGALMRIQANDIQNKLDSATQHIDVTNPEGTSRFIIHQRGLATQEFEDHVGYINNNFKENFSDLDPEKRFSIIIRKNNGKYYYIDKFPNTVVSWVDNISQLDTASKVATAVTMLGMKANRFIDAGIPAVKDALDGLAMAMGPDYVPRRRDEWNGYFVRNPEKYDKIKPFLDVLEESYEHIPTTSYQHARARNNAEYAAQYGLAQAAEEKAAYNTQKNSVQNPNAIDQEKVLEDAGDLITDNTLRQMTEARRSQAEENVENGLVEPLKERIREKIERNPDSRTARLWNYIKGIYRWGREMTDVFAGTEKVSPGAQGMITGIYSKGRFVQDVMVPAKMMNTFADVIEALKSDKSIHDFEKVYRQSIETEYKVAFNEKNNPNISPEKLSKETISFKRDEPFDFKDFFSKDDTIRQFAWKRFIEASNDPLKWSKFIVQKLGVPAEQYLEFMKKYKTSWVDYLEKTRQKYDESGYLMSADLQSGLKNSLEKAFLKMMLDKAMGLKGENPTMSARLFDLHSKLKSGKEDFNNENVKIMMTELAKTLPNKLDEKQIAEGFTGTKQNRFKILLDLYYNRLDNLKMTYTSHVVVGDLLNKTKFPREIENYVIGKSTKGAKALNPLMREITGRKYATIEDLIKADYKFLHNGIQADAAEMTYIQERLFRRGIPEAIRKTTAQDCAAAVQLYRQTKDRKFLYEFLDNFNGFVVKLPKEYMGKLNKKLKNLGELVETMTKSGDLEKAKIAKDKYDALEYKILLYENLNKFWNGEIVAEVEGTINGKNLSSDTRSEVSKNFVKDIENRITENRWALETGVKELFVAGNKNSLKKNDFNDESVLYDRIRRTSVDRTNLRVDNMPNWEGIYIHEYLYRPIMQYWFGQNTRAKFSNYRAVESTIRLFQKWNLFQKFAGLYKPFTMAIYDLPATVTGAGFRSITDINNGIAMMRSKEKPDTEFGKLFWLADKNDLYNRIFDYTSPVPKLMESYYKLLGETKFNDLIRQISGEKNFLKKLYVGGRYIWRTNQDYAWFFDDVIRSTSFYTIFKRYRAGYDGHVKAGKWTANMADDEAAKVASSITNNLMMQYSKYPRSTIELLNFFVGYPSIKLGTIQMYSNLFKNFMNGAAGVAAGRPLSKSEFAPMYGESPRQAALRQMAPVMRSMVMRMMFKGLMTMFTGWAGMEVWEWLAGYRKGKVMPGSSSELDDKIRFFALQGPLWEIDKAIQRPFRVTLMYNMAALPRLLMMLATNTNPITMQRVWTVDPKHEPAKAAAQLGIQTLQMHFPLAFEYQNLTPNDLTLIEKIINFSGMGYFYNTESPRELLEKYRESIDKSKTLEDRERAGREFYRALKITNAKLFGTKYADLSEMMKQMEEERTKKKYEPLE